MSGSDNHYVCNKLIEDLKIDLSVKENNKENTSKLGGNASELFFLLTSNITFSETENGSDLSIDYDKSTNSLLFKYNAKKFYDQKSNAILTYRNQLSELFVNSGVNNYSFQQFSDLNFLKKFLEKIPNYDLAALYQCSLYCVELKESCLSKKSIKDSLLELYRKEREVLFEKYKNSYCFGVPVNALRAYISSTFTGYNASLKLINDRYDLMDKAIFAKEHYDLMENINSYPRWIKILALRLHLGLSNIVDFNLDSFISCKD